MILSSFSPKQWKAPFPTLYFTSCVTLSKPFNLVIDERVYFACGRLLMMRKRVKRKPGL